MIIENVRNNSVYQAIHFTKKDAQEILGAICGTGITYTTNRYDQKIEIFDESNIYQNKKFEIEYGDYIVMQSKSIIETLPEQEFLMKYRKAVLL